MIRLALLVTIALLAVVATAASAGAVTVRYTITPLVYDESTAGPYKPVSAIRNGDQVKWRITRSAIAPGKAYICFKLCRVLHFTGLTATAPLVLVTRAKFGPRLKVVVTDDANRRSSRTFPIS